MITKKFELGVGGKLNYKILKDGYNTITETLNITDELSTDTVLDLVPSSTLYNSDLEYSVNQDMETAPLMTLSDVTLPDTQTILGNKKLWYPYDNGKQYKCPKSDPIEKNNFTTVGNVIINDGVASNFLNKSNHIVIPSNFSYSSNFILQLKLNITSISVCNTFLGNDNDSPVNSGIVLRTQSGARIYLWGTTNNSSWTTEAFDTGIDLIVGIQYIRLIHTSSTYQLQYSLDGTTWTSGNVLTTSSFTDGTKWLGSTGNSSSFYTYGSIDLKESYIKIDDEYFWKPVCSDYEVNATKVGSVVVDKDWNASNFSSSNYLKLPNILNFYNKDFEMVVKFNLTDVTTRSKLYGCASYSDEKVVTLQVQNGHPGWSIPASSGTSWQSGDVYSSSYTISTNTWYWMKLKCISNNYTLLMSVDGKNWEIVQTYAGTELYNNTTYYYALGEDIYAASYSSPTLGSIDLKECYIKINEEEVWRALSSKSTYYQGIMDSIDDYNISGGTYKLFYCYKNFPDEINYYKMNTSVITSPLGGGDWTIYPQGGYGEAYIMLNVSNSPSYPRWQNGSPNTYVYFKAPKKFILGKYTTKQYADSGYNGRICNHWIIRGYETEDDLLNLRNGTVLDNNTWSSISRLSSKEVVLNNNKAFQYYTICMVSNFNNDSSYTSMGETNLYEKIVGKETNLLIATSQNAPIEENDYYQYIQNVIIPPFVEYQYNSDETWVGMTDVTLTLDQDDAEFSIEEVE